MQLRFSPTSPFARKVRIAAAILGLADRIDLVPADITDPADSLRKQNPLGKLPTLVLDDGEVLFDSRVIVAYLDDLAGGRLTPAGFERFRAQCLEALADGVMDAAVLQVYEVRFRDEPKRDPRWVARQAEKVSSGLTALEGSPPSIEGTIHAGHIALACALGMLDLRFEGAWRAGHPRLVAWLAAFERRVPAYEETRFKG